MRIAGVIRKKTIVIALAIHSASILGGRSGAFGGFILGGALRRQFRGGDKVALGVIFALDKDIATLFEVVRLKFRVDNIDC